MRLQTYIAPRPVAGWFPYLRVPLAFPPVWVLRLERLTRKHVYVGPRTDGIRWLVEWRRLWLWWS